MFGIVINMIRIFKGLRSVSRLTTTPFHFSTAKEDTYIPIRPLKDDKNLLFTIGMPSNISFSAKVLIFTPFLATSLDGFINEWTNWRIAGSLLFLLAGFRVVHLFNFLKAHQVYSLKTNRDLSKFYLTITNNHFGKKFQEILLEQEKRTFEQKFKQSLKNKTLEISEQIYEQLSTASESQLTSQMNFLKTVRQGIILEINRKDIEKFEFASEQQVRKIVRQDLLRYLLGSKKKQEVLEEYSAIKDKRNFVLITTRPFKKWNDRPVHFFLNLDVNIEKKYEEYVKALAEGKKIVQP